MRAVDIMPAVFYQALCTCGHQRGYHTNNGAGGCAGRVVDGKANPCEASCRSFAAPPADMRVRDMYGEAPIGDPQSLVGKKIRHKDVPDVVGLCTNVFRFAEDSNPMCRCEFAIPDERNNGRMRTITSLHYAGNLQEVTDGS